MPKKLEPVDDAFGEFSNISHPDKWKVIYFYPKDFTFICPTEILGFDSIQRSGEAVVYGGSVDNEHVKLAWNGNAPEHAAWGWKRAPVQNRPRLDRNGDADHKPAVEVGRASNRYVEAARQVEVDN